MEDKYKGERVLVFERKLLDSLGAFQGISRDVDRYLLPILDKKNNHFHLRFQAEQDESLKQIISYVLFVCQDKVFSYVRGKQSGETRLVGNRSIGIGGHINPIDETLFGGGLISSDMQTYLEAVRREIDEEVTVQGEYSPEIAGLINDDSNSVGRVHFAVVHVCRLSDETLVKKEQQITKSGFFSIAELAGSKREELESWSSLALDLLLNT